MVGNCSVPNGALIKDQIPTVEISSILRLIIKLSFTDSFSARHFVAKKVAKNASAPSTTRPVVTPVSAKRGYLKQSDVPLVELEEALRIPNAILENYGGRPTTPLSIGAALQIDAKGTQLRVLSGAAIAFGLIDGGAQAQAISVTDLARRILRPLKEDDSIRGKREALLRPRVFSEFLGRYDQSPLPRKDIGINVLEELGVPRDKAELVLSRLEESAKKVGFFTEIKGKPYIDLSTTQADTSANEEIQTEISPSVESDQIDQHRNAKKEMKVREVAETGREKRVFITHGKNTSFVDALKQLLALGDMEAAVAVEKQSVSQPVPEKVMDEMRRAGAAIIHVDSEKILKDQDDKEHVLLNQNVLIEIGAAMAFYGRRFILLVQEDLKLPSNLQGLYEVRYSGDELSGEAAIRVLKAIKDIKNHELPR